jgi:CubicO group peptidase (beta-lactamase class C family)
LVRFVFQIFGAIHMNRSYVLAAVLVLLSTGPVWGQTVPISGSIHAPIGAIDQAMIGMLQKIGCTAGAVAISQGDTLLYERGYGWLDREHTTPAPATVRMGIASCEKPITAAAVRKLARDGLLDLNAPLFETLKIVPAGKVVDPRVFKITIDDLLEHKAGWGGDIHQSLADAAQADGFTAPFGIRILLGGGDVPEIGERSRENFQIFQFWVRDAAVCGAVHDSQNDRLL